MYRRPIQIHILLHRQYWSIKKQAVAKPDTFSTHYIHRGLIQRDTQSDMQSHARLPQHCLFGLLLGHQLWLCVCLFMDEYVCVCVCV